MQGRESEGDKVHQTHDVDNTPDPHINRGRQKEKNAKLVCSSALCKIFKKQNTHHELIQFQNPALHNSPDWDPQSIRKRSIMCNHACNQHSKRQHLGIQVRCWVEVRASAQACCGTGGRVAAPMMLDLGLTATREIHVLLDHTPSHVKNTTGAVTDEVQWPIILVIDKLPPQSPELAPLKFRLMHKDRGARHTAGALRPDFDLEQVVRGQHGLCILRLEKNRVCSEQVFSEVLAQQAQTCHQHGRAKSFVEKNL